MKSYANFILMENLLYNVPREAIAIATLSDVLLNPRVRLVDENCGTYLGTQFDSTFLNSGQPADRNGKQLIPYLYALKASGPLPVGEVPPTYTQEELSQAIASGERFKRVLHPFSCISKGGICRVCAYSSYRFSTAKVVDTGTNTTYEYFEEPAPLDLVIPPVGSTTQLQEGFGRVKSFLSPSQKSLFSWLANTYSGSLLGIRNFGNFPLPVNTELYSFLINKNLLAQAQAQLSAISAVPRDVITYIDSIESVLEKALMVVVAYTMYGPRYRAPVSDAPTITA